MFIFSKLKRDSVVPQSDGGFTETDRLLLQKDEEVSYLKYIHIYFTSKNSKERNGTICLIRARTKHQMGIINFISSI